MGPLDGITVIELAGIGPGPFCATLLSDMGARVVRVERPSAVRIDPGPQLDVLTRGRESIAIDMKKAEGVEIFLKLTASADALMEGFRPGVAERLGIGPEVCMARNPALVYGRMTGWGQDGPYAQAAGHDINYISLAGALEPIGRAGQAPVPPLNLVGDFGGGGMYLAFGMVCALLETTQSGQGQVVDAAMVDGAANLMNMFWSLKAMGVWNPERGTNMLDSGAHFYDVYACSDGLFISIGSIEPQFYSELLRLTGLATDPQFAKQHQRSQWPAMKGRLSALFKTKTRDEWCELMEHTDVCFAPVLSMEDAVEHPHMKERGTFIEINGQTQAGPAPRFSRTIAHVQGPPAVPGQDTDRVLQALGLGQTAIDDLRAQGAVA